NVKMVDDFNVKFKLSNDLTTIHIIEIKWGNKVKDVKVKIKNQFNITTNNIELSPDNPRGIIRYMEAKNRFLENYIPDNVDRAYFIVYFPPPN
ncbi:33467_t:CDS:1, partial [Racocetra persica]